MKVGALTFGGGYAMLPILQKDIVERYGWASEEEIMDYYAMAQCLPGIIMINTSVFIGRKHKGTLGGVVAGVASALPSLVIITIIANRRGLTDAAAVGIVEKIIGFLFLIPSSMLSTVSALGAQNIGAGKPERARLTLRYAAMIACSFGIAVVILTLFIAEPLVGLFTPDAAVAAAGGQYLRGYIWDSFFAGVQFSFSGYFCACGKSGISFLHNSLSILLVRVPGAYLASKYFPQTLLPMGLANAAGSLFSILVCVIAYAILTRREKRAQEAS